MHLHPISVSDAIAAHTRAIAADEAAYDDDGQPINLNKARLTGRAEELAYRKLIWEPCQSPSDVQAKIKYLVDGSVGQRDTLIESLLNFDDGGLTLVEAFLRSLLLPSHANAREG